MTENYEAAFIVCLTSLIKQSFSVLAQVNPQEFAVKPGKCPPEPGQGTLECPTPENTITECLLDKDCNGTRKCCSDGCSMRCLPAEALPTAAPIIGPKGARGR